MPGFKEVITKKRSQKEIGNKLKEYREEKRLSQFKLADLAEISGRTYADIELGKTDMRVSTLQSICDVLDITPNDAIWENADKTISTEDLVIQIKQSNDRKRQLICSVVEMLMKEL